VLPLLLRVGFAAVQFAFGLWLLCVQFIAWQSQANAAACNATVSALYDGLALENHGYGSGSRRIQQSLWWPGSSRRAMIAMGLPQRSQSTAGLGWMTTGGAVGM
jgi:hypothetical protein